MRRTGHWSIIHLLCLAKASPARSPRSVLFPNWVRPSCSLDAMCPSEEQAGRPSPRSILRVVLTAPITVIRGLAQVCDMDLSLTHKVSWESHPNHPRDPGPSWSRAAKRTGTRPLHQQVWYCTSSRSPLSPSTVEYLFYLTQGSQR